MLFPVTSDHDLIMACVGYCMDVRLENVGTDRIVSDLVVFS